MVTKKLCLKFPRLSYLILTILTPSMFSKIISISLLISLFLGASVFEDGAYEQYTWQSFNRIEALQRPIDFAEPDYGLLNAAVFYVTNQERAQRNLPLLSFSPDLRDIADHHARAMAEHDFVSHFNVFESRYRTLEQRSRAYGKEAHAENVASNFLHKYRSNTYYTPRPARPFYEYYDSQRRSIPVMSYLEFAENLVDDWMSSSGHRRNILFRELKSLGCAVRIPEGAGTKNEIPLAYCVQNFSY